MGRRAEGTSRTAFTLIEMILVLAILVAIGAIVAPSFNEAFIRQRLQSSADRLRSEWERARLTAMKTGQTQVFSCVLETGGYSVEPYMSDADLLNASAGATLTTTGGAVVGATTAGNLAAPAPTASEPKQLEEGITFISCAVSSDMRAMTVAQAEGGMAAASALNQSVMFYPDGSTSTAEVILQDVKGKQRAVRMRGLTGSTQVLTPGEMPAVAIAPTTQ
jgi:prepilin-type N-terminal cleavage/methylation domain-containing protein